jgi:alpha/beta superfamily hydrolase
LREAYANAAGPKELVIVPDADHFFVGKLNLMQAALEQWVAERFTANVSPWGRSGS